MRRFSATLLLGLLFSPNGGPVTLQPLTPSLGHAGPGLRIAWDAYDPHPLTAAGSLLAVHAAGAVEVVDTARLRVVRAYRLRRRDVCAVGLDGATPVALVGCSSSRSTRYAVIRFADPSTRWITVRRPLAPLAYPVSFAFGGGKVFVVRAGAAVDVVDLRTGAVSAHRPRRALAKGEGYVRANWLGGHLLGLAGTVVDVRTWKARTLAAHAQETVGGGGFLATYGPAGITVYTRRDLRLYRRLLRGRYVDQARIVEGLVYARIALVWQVIDLRTGRMLVRLVPDDGESLWLV